MEIVERAPGVVANTERGEVKMTQSGLLPLSPECAGKTAAQSPHSLIRDFGDVSVSSSIKRKPQRRMDPLLELQAIAPCIFTPRSLGGENGNRDGLEAALQQSYKMCQNQMST